MGVIINRRRVYGGRKLPYDAEVEYLESNSGQFINTKIVPYRGLETTIDFQYTSLKANQSLFGCWRTGTPTVIYQVTLYNGKWYFGSYSSSESNTSWLNNAVNTKRHTISIDGNGSISQDGVSLRTASVSPNNTWLPLYIFRRNLNRAGEEAYSNIRCYSFRMVNNGKLIFNGIPVRVGNVGYLYDKVSGQLYGNSGTGEFILGPDVMGGVILELIRPTLGERRAA